MAHKQDVDSDKLEQAGFTSDKANDSNALTNEHRDYLLARHGTLELDPLPSANDLDPLNWRKSKKILVLAMVAFHAMMNTFIATSIQSAFEPISVDLGVSLQTVSYLVSLFIAVLGVAPFFWCPIADRWGRRPVFLISMLLTAVGNIGCAVSPNYSSMAGCRAVTAFFVSPAGAIGTGIVADMFQKKERGRFIGIWSVMITLGVPVSPLIFGFVALRVNYRWIFWILTVTNGVQFILWLFLGEETLYNRGHPELQHKSKLSSLLKIRRIDPKPLTWSSFVHPLRYAVAPCVVLPAASYAMVFLFGSILVSIEIPQLYVEIYSFNTQQVGLQFIAMIIGSLIGEVIGGLVSDNWMSFRKGKIGHDPEPEFHLWLSYMAYPLNIIGVAVFLALLGTTGSGWTVGPDVGAAIAATGNQIATTVLITYAVDCYRHDAASVGVFIVLVRQIWGFIGPFWFPPMIENAGLDGAAGIQTAMTVVVCFPASILLQWRGKRWR